MASFTVTVFLFLQFLTRLTERFVLGVDMFVETLWKVWTELLDVLGLDGEWGTLGSGLFILVSVWPCGRGEAEGGALGCGEPAQGVAHPGSVPQVSQAPRGVRARGSCARFPGKSWGPGLLGSIRKRKPVVQGEGLVENQVLAESSGPRGCGDPRACWVQLLGLVRPGGAVP